MFILTLIQMLLQIWMNLILFLYWEKNMSKNEIYIIAEIGLNHNGNISLAKKMISSAKLLVQMQ